MKSLKEEVHNINKESLRSSITSAILKMKGIKIENDRNKLDIFKSQMNLFISKMIIDKYVPDSVRRKINKLKKQVGLSTSYSEEIDVYIDILELLKNSI